MSQFLPSGQKRLTNIAVVRYKRAGKKFEVACYKNTIIAWRNKVETDIDEVLQAHTIFSDVGRGILAKREDLLEAFGTDDEDVICLEVLNKGDFQVSEQERQAQLDTLMKDIASKVADMIINPETGRPYPQPTVERAMRESIHFAPNERKSAKQQALGVVKALQASDALPIMRALMHLRLVMPANKLDEARAGLRGLEGAEERMQLGKVEAHDNSPEAGATAPSDVPFVALECRADPSLYRPIAELVGLFGGSLHMVAHKASGGAAESGEGSGRVASVVGSGTQAPVAASHDTAVGGTTAAGAPIAPERGEGGRGGGRGGKDDDLAAAARRAERMFKVNLRSADHGDPVAQLEVGKAYLNGVGVEHDAVQARHWLEQALRQGVQAAKAHLDQLPGA